MRQQMVVPMGLVVLISSIYSAMSVYMAFLSGSLMPPILACILPVDILKKNIQKNFEGTKYMIKF